MEIKRSMQAPDSDLIEDDTLRAAAEMALEAGDAIVVYTEEIRHDA